MKKIFILPLLFLCSQLAFSQGGSFIMSYPISFPVGDLHSYTSATSFRGFSMEFNKHQRSDLDVGIEVTWNVFYQREAEKVYTDGSASISGVQYRYTNAVPLLAQVKWYKEAGNGKTFPYVGLGLGTLYVNRSTDFGLYRITNENWQFCIRPELGLTIRMQPGIAAMIGAKYYAAFGNSNLDGQSYLSANVGLIFSSGW